MKTDANCIFCQIIAGQVPCFKLLEDENTIAIMDIFPANDGHCLVLTKEHYPTVFDVTDEAFAAVSRSVRKVAGSQPRFIASGTEPSPGKRAGSPPNGCSFSCSHTAA